MKLLFSISYYTPYVSGLTIYAKRLAEELVKRGSETTVLCWRHGNDLTDETINGVRVIRVEPQIKISKGFLGWGWISKSWNEVKKHGVVIVNLPQVEGFVPALMARLLKKRIIAIYHCEIELPSKLMQAIVEMANWVTLKLADKIITYTKDYADSCKLLNGFMVDCLYPPIPYPKTGKLRLHKPKGEIWIGVAARLAQEKGIEYLIEALPLLRNCKIVIAGPTEPVGEEEYKNKIMKLVEKYKDRVRFLGIIEEMGSFYKVIDVLALPSVNSTEAFGMVQVEAMMMGIPVVASDLPGVRVPILKTGMGRLARPRDSRSLADAVSWVLKNKNKFKRETAVTEFNMGDVMQKWQMLIA